MGEENGADPGVASSPMTPSRRWFLRGFGFTTSRRTAPALLLGVLVVFAGACGGGGGGSDEASVYERGFRKADALRVQTLSSETGETYEYRQAGDLVTVSAPDTNSPVKLGTVTTASKNVIGEAFWVGGQTMRTDQEVCVTMHSAPDGSTPDLLKKQIDDPSLLMVPGVALRIRPSSKDGRDTRAIVIGPNGRNGAIWIFDVVVVASGFKGDASTADIATAGNMDFSAVLGKMSGHPDEAGFRTSLKPPPWHMCARGIGTEISVMVWTGDEKQPSWSDVEHVQVVEVPREWVGKGYAGAYVKGLSPGHSAEFEDLTVTSPY